MFGKYHNGLKSHFDDRNRTENTFIEDIKAKAILDQKKADHDIEIVNFMEHQARSLDDSQKHIEELQNTINIGYNKLKAFENKYGKVLECDSCSKGRISTRFSGMDDCRRCDGTGFIAPDPKEENNIKTIIGFLTNCSSNKIITDKMYHKLEEHITDYFNKNK